MLCTAFCFVLCAAAVCCVLLCFCVLLCVVVCCVLLCAMSLSRFPSLRKFDVVSVYFDTLDFILLAFLYGISVSHLCSRGVVCRIYIYNKVKYFLPSIKYKLYPTRIQTPC